MKATRLTRETMPSQHIARAKEVSVKMLNTRLLLSSLAAFACLGGALPLVCAAPRQRSQFVVARRTCATYQVGPLGESSQVSGRRGRVAITCNVAITSRVGALPM